MAEGTARKATGQRGRPRVIQRSTGKRPAVEGQGTSGRVGRRTTAAAPLIFLSYKHGKRWTPIAERLELKLRVISRALDLRIFFDAEIDPGLVWRAAVQNALKACTHFVVLLCDDYWDSVECQNELEHALRRYRASGRSSPRLLFILGERMRPELLLLGGGGKAGDVVKKVSDINFLGPYDSARRLVRLAAAGRSEKLADQLSDITSSLVTLLQKR